jgi:hypothetical protein
MFTIIVMLMVVLMIGCKKNDDQRIPPTVTSTYPINEALSTAVSSDITATFSVPMSPSTITILSFNLKQGTLNISGVTGYTDSIATFNPAANLAPNTIYMATITTGVRDISGVSMVKDFTWSFTTGGIPDITQPIVNSTDPLNNATDVAVNQVVVLMFSEAMDPLTITASTFTLKQGLTLISGAVAYSGTTATFTPANLLAAGTVYNATITTGGKRPGWQSFRS